MVHGQQLEAAVETDHRDVVDLPYVGEVEGRLLLPAHGAGVESHFRIYRTRQGREIMMFALLHLLLLHLDLSLFKLIDFGANGFHLLHLACDFISVSSSVSPTCDCWPDVSK